MRTLSGSAGLIFKFHLNELHSVQYPHMHHTRDVVCAYFLKQFLPHGRCLGYLRGSFSGRHWSSKRGDTGPWQIPLLNDICSVLYPHLRQEWKLCAKPWVFSIFKYIPDQEMLLIASHITQTGNQHDKLERQRLLESNHKALDPQSLELSLTHGSHWISPDE